MQRGAQAAEREAGHSRHPSGDEDSRPGAVLAGEEDDAGLYQYRKGFMKRFPRGELVTLDVPHYMEPEIPDRIVQELEQVIAQAR